jgi:TolB protein
MLKYFIMALTIFIPLLMVLTSMSCTCNCSTVTNPPGGGWNPDMLNFRHRIAFKSSRDGNEQGDLHLMDLGGENLIKIASNLAFMEIPRWSSDGTRLAFRTREELASSGQDYTLDIVDYEGNNVASIDDLPRFSYYWSPDGTKIAFSFRNSEEETCEIYTVDSDGNNLASLVTVPGRSVTPQWSPDGARILFQSDLSGDDLNSLYVMDSDGSNLIVLLDDFEHVFTIWSPDSSKIVYSTIGDEARDVDVVNADGTGLVNITNGDYGLAQAMSWSPDSQKIRFISYIDEDPVTLDSYSVNADGTSLVPYTMNGEDLFGEMPSPDGSKIIMFTMIEEERLYYITNGDGQGPIRILENAERVLSIEWAPDSSKIGYTIYNDDPDRPGTDVHNIYVMNADGTGVVDLVHSSSERSVTPPFIWSPDSKKIIFTNTIDDDEDIYIINADGTGLTNLTNDPGRDWDPVLSR